MLGFVMWSKISSVGFISGAGPVETARSQAEYREVVPMREVLGSLSQLERGQTSH